MSKAFTSEETPDVPPLTRAAPTLAPGELRYVTPEGHAALTAEVERLRQERESLLHLPELERVGLEELNQRLALHEQTLAVLTVLGPEAVPEGQVGFGCWVEVEDEDGARTLWRIVGPDEADPRRRQVSVHSPLGRALLGRQVGDAVTHPRPGGAVELSVVSVLKRRL
jgi:transcription elongation factor GreB